MRTDFTDQEIADYRANGFVKVENLLDPSELARWREAVDAAIASDLVQQPEGSDPQVYTERMNLRWVSPAVGELVEDPAIGRLAVDLEGVDAVRVYLDQALVKEPFSTSTSYHLDLPWWAFDSDNACTVWIALDDATVENGCLHFVPGSHRLRLRHRSLSAGTDLGGVFAAHPEAAERAPVACPVPAGGCTVHNARTIHGAGANMTPGRRRAMTVAFMPDGVRYNATRDVRSLGREYLDVLTVGDLLQNDDLNPIVYRRATITR